MRKLYYVTRTYLPEKTGGVIVRTHTVELLKKYFSVEVITCQDGTSIQEDVDRIHPPGNLKLFNYLQRLGLLCDSLAPWAKVVANKYSKVISENDIVFCTSGGDMGTLYVGYLLKLLTNCKYVVNLRDPSIYTKVNGLKIDSKFHVSRERFERKLLGTSDLIITSSLSNMKSLINKYPQLKKKIVNNYFGYIFNPKEIVNKTITKPHFVYGGRFGPLQSPEILAEAFSKVDGIDVSFIGNYKLYKPLWKYTDRFKFIEHLPQDEYHILLNEKATVGLLSLSNDYLGACVPAKLFDYIGIGLPSFGLLPYGDAYDIINNNNFGRAVYYKENIEKIVAEIELMCDQTIVEKMQNSLIAKYKMWSMDDYLFDELLSYLNSI